MTKNFKTFDGKKYEIEYRTDNQGVANKLARDLRKTGKHVRTVKHVRTEYRVYKR